MGFFNNNKPKSEPNVVPASVPKVPEPAAKPSDKPVVAASAPPANITPSSPLLTQSNNTSKTMNESITTISAGTILEGHMKLEGDLYVEGTIKGTVTSKSKVTLGANGKIEGDVNCQEAEISGKVMGKLNVNDMLFLKGNALVDGDINTGKLVMESGVRFNGKCNMGAKNAATNAATPPTAAAATQANGTMAKANA
jgi:cytoskeletal protein CcmA (bactofilin family)